MDILTAIFEVLLAGINGLLVYLSAHVLLCLIPAFFIAGALSALFKKEAVTRYLGAETPKRISYPIASIAGLLIAVCSCTILPLFAGIWKKGAGLGPAVTFLFTGPAINILAITYTGSLIGWDIAAARGILAVVFGIVIGLLMGLLFGRMKQSGLSQRPDCRGSDYPAQENDTTKKAKEKRTISDMADDHRSVVLFMLLIGVLIAGTLPIDLILRMPFIALFVALSVIWALKKIPKNDNREWMRETYFFAKMILPLLLIGVFVAGMASALIPPEIIGEHLGSNTLSANLIAVAFGVFMYFPTLVEVPVARMFLDLGMAKGPLLAYLLADPELSFQSILVIRKVMGSRKTLTYVALVAVFCTAAGLIFGLFLR
ncbi:MAG: permease [Thermoplasmata archaeon]